MSSRLQRMAAIAMRKPRKHAIASSNILIPGKNVAVYLNSSSQLNVINTQLTIFTKAMQERAVDTSFGCTNFVIIDLIPDNGIENAKASGLTPKRVFQSFDRPIARYVEITLICPMNTTQGSDGL